MQAHRAGILIVEDDELVRKGLSIILTSSGYRVRSACDGVAALAELHVELPDIVVSDLNMAGMSGFELLPEVRRDFPTVWIIAMSSAFPGKEVPPGVTADAYHEKASSIGSMLLMVKFFADQKGRSPTV